MDQIPYKTIIVDDEPPATQRLLELLAYFPQTFEIIGQAANGSEAICLIKTLKPDLVFLDIQMPGMTGFEMLQQIDEIPMIIFCTAYDQYSLEAFETNSVDYLVKPVRLERLEQTVAKLKFFKHDSHQIIALLKEISDQSVHKPMVSITVRNGSKLSFVKLEDIAYFKAGDKYVSMFTCKGEEKVTEKTLMQLEEKLPDYFLRVHRSIIINTQIVKEVQTFFNCRYSILLTDNYQSKITTGRNYQMQIKKWMELK